MTDVVVSNIGFFLLSFLRSGGQDNSEEDYTKGLIVSFTAKKIGGEDKTEKAAEETEKVTEEKSSEETEEVAEEKAADKEGGDEGDKLSREDIKSALAKFGIIRVHFSFIHALKCFMHQFQTVVLNAWCLLPCAVRGLCERRTYRIFAIRST